MIVFVNTYIKQSLDLNIEHFLLQKQRIKVAFAEGYLAGNTTEGGQKSGRAMKYLKVI